jgi:lysophospholipase L1-like esterase
VSAVAESGGTARITYAPPEHQGGEPAITVNCTPASGETFPVGSTRVECVIADSLSRRATCSFSVIVTAAPRLRLTRFMAFGDSLTSGETVIPGTDDVETRSNPEAAYPAVLARLLSMRYATQHFVVANQGKAAERAELALGRFVDAFRLESPEAVILLEGVNDIIAASTPSLGLDAAEKGVGLLAADARFRRARVFICTLTPTKPGRRHVPLAIIQAFNDRLRRIARAEEAVLIDIFTPLVVDLNTMVDSDGLHLTEAGYRRVAETVFSAIREDLEIK